MVQGESGRPSELALLLLEQQLLETKHFITQLQSSLPDSRFDIFSFIDFSDDFANIDLSHLCTSCPPVS